MIANSSTQHWVTKLTSSPWTLLLVAAVLLLSGTGTLPLIDRDEPRFAQATREMIQREDWVVPTFNGDYRFDKPILIYWMMRGTFALTGDNELGTRLPSVISALGLILLVYHAGKRLGSAQTGWLAGLMLATCLQMQLHGRMALADMPMILAVTLANLAAFRLLFPDEGRQKAEGTRQKAEAGSITCPSSPVPPIESIESSPPTPARCWFWLFYGSLGLGFLAKGPIAWAVPAITLLVFRFLYLRKPLPWGNLKLAWGLPIALLIVAAWGIPALIATDGGFLKIGIGQHVVNRGLEIFNKRHYNPFFYFITIFLSLLPYSGMIIALPWIYRKHRSRELCYLFAWITAPFILFTPYATQLPHYTMPAFPALFLVMALALSSAVTLPPALLRIARGFAWFVLGLAVIIAVTLLYAISQAGALTLAVPLLWAMLWLSGLGLSGILFFSRKPQWAYLGLAVMVVGFGLFASNIRGELISLKIDAVLKEHTAIHKLIGYKFGEPSAVYYGDRRVVWTTKPEDFAAACKAADKPYACVLLLEERDPFKAIVNALKGQPTAPSDPTHLLANLKGLKEFPTPDQSEITILTGFNFGRTRLQTVAVWESR
ncbi:MAG: glycosyltransferase family 39 protein [Verrucomicrobiota bacterium]|nr:glycosyltransferase family 39 protein [Verrucomicrobiota bacterium]